jgi:CSLREA domain-containing protein
MGCRGWIGALGISLLGMVVPAGAGAVVITPTTTADEYNENPAACSLREAIESANTDSVVNADGCTQGSGTDEIDLEARIYRLTIPSANPGGGLNLEGDLDISTDNVEIDGPDVGRAVIDGNGTVTGSRTIEIPNLGPAGILVRFHKLEIIGGDAVTGSVSGGAIAVNGVGFPHDLLITRSTITGNRGIKGGGIDLAGQSSLTLRNTTISGNDATVDGGGIHADSSNITVISNATIVGNRANSDGDFIGDGGGVVSDGGDLHLHNTILAGNLDLGQDLNDAPDCEGTATVESSGFSLIGNTSNCPYTAGPGDITGADPRLGPLADNGGTSRTRALLAGSPAIDHGSTEVGSGNACESDDQRDLDRSLGGRCDIGAYERVVCGGVAVNRIGTEADDVLLGTTAADSFLLLGGNDVAHGGAGGDRFCGGSGKDKLFGQGGKDRLLGQAGRDRLFGGAKRDRLLGGKGRDLLVGGKGRDRCKGGPGRDRQRAC